MEIIGAKVDEPKSLHLQTRDEASDNVTDSQSSKFKIR